MKKKLSLVLAVIMLLSVFTGCSTVPEKSTFVNGNITVATSSAQNLAGWLTERLSFIPDEVIMAVGDNNDYGIDMTDFEDDGYVIKSMGDSVLLLGKTEEGLDLAARKYANSVDLGTNLEDTVYHEGYRIEKFTLFGRDISDYTINYPADHNENMSFAASELQMLIEKGCGASLPLVVGETDASPLIRLEYSDKEEFKVGGYEYFEENGDLIFSSAKREGNTNAVYRFLENECGWDFLTYGNSDLQETDHLNLEAGLYKTETPAFEWHIVSRNLSNDMFISDRTVSSREYLGITKAQQSYPVTHANHGMVSNGWADWIPTIHTGQMCYTTESYYYTSLDNILEYLEEKEAAGEVIGETIRAIDISQGDSGTYCQCKNCLSLLGEEKSVLGGVMRFANGIAEEVNAKYPGKDIIFKIFAYWLAFPVPEITKPNEWISVSYAPNGSCANHIMDGSQCDPNTDVFYGLSGCDYGQYLEDWCEVSDNTYVWYYHINDNFAYYNVWDLIYYDYKHMYELGVKGLYFYNYARGMALKTVEHMLAWYLYWDIDMTWEEYEALYDRLLEKEYGDGWESMKEITRMYGEAENDKCWHCWGYSDRFTALDMYDVSYFAENYETMADHCERAIKLATNPYQETLAEMFSVSIYYCGCMTNFFKYRDNGDTEGLAKLEAQYQTVIDRFEKNGYSYTYIPNISHFAIGETIWEEAGNQWTNERYRLPSGSDPTEYDKVDGLNAKIPLIGDVTNEDSAISVIKMIEDYSSLSVTQKAEIVGIEAVMDKLDEAIAVYGEEENTIKVMSFNVYYKELTPERIARVAERILEENPDIVGLQEGTPAMCDGLAEILGDKYRILGTGRNGDDASENCNVMYKIGEFRYAEFGTVWLSETPEEYSVLNGAGLPRIATYQRLIRESDEKIFVHINTHFDLNGSAVRGREAEILTDFIEEKFSKYPVIITGDFNCTEGSYEFGKLTDAGYKVTSSFGEKVPTFNGCFSDEDPMTIDFTFVNGQLPVKSYKVCDPMVNGEYASDHNAIVSEVLLAPTFKYLVTPPKD